MAKRGWTIMEALPTNPQNTGTAAKPVTSTHKASTAGSGMEAAQVDSSSSTPTESEKTRLEEFFNNATENGINVIEEPSGWPVFKFFLAKGKPNQ